MTVLPAHNAISRIHTISSVSVLNPESAHKPIKDRCVWDDGPGNGMVDERAIFLRGGQ